MTKGLVRLLPQELQPVPHHSAAVTSAEELRVACSIAEAKPKPGQFRKDDAASQQRHLIPVTVRVGRSNIAVRIQRQQTKAGAATSQVMLLPHAFRQPGRNEKNPPAQGDLQMRYQHSAEHHQRGARPENEATQRPLRAKHYLECI